MPAAVGVYFLLARFFVPLASLGPPDATAPAILFVASTAASPLAEYDWKNPAEYAPAFGIGPGRFTYMAVKSLSGRFAELSPAVLRIGAVFVLHIALG